jgi:hypothetical protein
MRNASELRSTSSQLSACRCGVVGALMPKICSDETLNKDFASRKKIYVKRWKSTQEFHSTSQLTPDSITEAPCPNTNITEIVDFQYKRTAVNGWRIFCET